ncbi:hypothetical protein FI667_g10281, partial [Globisporangium splendens]
MSISVSRESISKLMTELVDTFPMESDGRSSISDFGKLLFTEGQASTSAVASNNNNNSSNISSNTNSNNNSAHSASDDNDDEEEEEDDEDDEEEEDEEQSALEDAKIASATPLTANGSVIPAAPGQKRVFTEIKGVPRQKQPDVQCVVTENGKIALSQSSMRKIMKSKDKAVPKRWTQEEDDRLREAVGRHGERNWKSIAEEVPGRNHTQCLQRWTKVLAPGLVKGHWRPDEDELLKELVAEGRKNWGQVATRIPGRTSKQCRERWYNHLDPSIVRGEYSAEEDRIILEAQSRLGNRWSAIAAMLPGRTEDAVKIRWKSLCRVRKGQGRRAQGDNKSKVTTPKGMMSGGMPLGVPPHMMHHGGGAFGAALGVKSEELGSFSSGMRVQQQMQMNARMQYANPAMGGQSNGMGYHVMNGGAMMYASDMSAYDPNQYRKQQQMAAAYGLPPTAPSQVPGGQDYNLDRRANAVNLHPQNGMPMAAQGGYRTTGAYPGSYAMATTTDGNIYNQAGGYSTASVAQMYHPQQQQQHQMQQQQMMTSSYGYSVPTTTSNGMGTSGGNLAGSFAQQLMQQQQPSYQQQETEQATQEAPSPQQQQQKESAAADHAATNKSPMTVKAEGQNGSAPAAPFNPAAMFAQSQAQKASSSNASPSSFNGGNSNPVAAFLQQQQQKPNGTSGASTTRPPFNPAAAFAQRFSASGQKPPMPGASSTSTATTRPVDDDETGANGDKTVEPSLKKVKPRLSIDAARASAARRMRSSGSGAALAGRGSLDVFLNEIGDVGRLSDLKMDEFQTLDELWRVSDDMNRLSL